MPRVQLLPDEVASQVAAGEVVERPASVIKELVENSIDANATRIEVQADRGGIALMRVVDNGTGMSREDAELAIQRHATSKIRSGHDLAAISTLGFRGEALPSIASVSRFLLSTREAEAIAGTEIRIAGGKVESIQDGGDAPGTRIEVRSLFYNLPARRKFLRTESTEASHVDHQLQLIALAHPSVGITYLRDNRLVFQLPISDTLGGRIRDLAGRAMLDELIPVEDAWHDAARVSGFIGKPGVTRSTRAQTHCFVNGRAVENSAILHGLREGYHTALQRGQYPVVYLFLDVPMEEVDVNVHPAKREIRFHRHTAVQSAVAESIRRTLIPRSKTPAAPAAPEPLRHAVPQKTPMLQVSAPVASPLPPAPTHLAVPRPSQPILPEMPAKQPAPPTAAPETEHPLTGRRFIGFLRKNHALMESEEGLVLLDQRAARERILFEKLRSSLSDEPPAQQRLLITPVLTLPPRDADWVRSNLPLLQRLGIGLDAFGPDTFKLESLPQWLQSAEPATLVRRIIDDIGSSDKRTARTRMEEEALIQQVCRHATWDESPQSESAVRDLLKDLFSCELPYCCPRGRPTLIQISFSELERKFGKS